MRTRTLHLALTFVLLGLVCPATLRAEEPHSPRDYKLEAIDDSAKFYLKQDLGRFFVAKRRVEESWSDSAKLRTIFDEYGIRNEQHWHQVEATVERFRKTPAAKAAYGSDSDIEQLRMNALREWEKGQREARAEGELAPLLQPVEGVSIEQYGAVNARIAQGVPLATALKDSKIPKAKWNRASAAWLKRMKEDKTFTVSAAYGKAYVAAGQGQFGSEGRDAANAMAAGGKLSGKEPFSFEKWVEIMQHQSVAYQHGVPAAKVLKEYKMNASDWATASAWWSEKLNRESMKNDGEMLKKLNEYTEKYQKQYKERYDKSNPPK
jgi:hypothetical protein